MINIRNRQGHIFLFVMLEVPPSIPSRTSSRPFGQNSNLKKSRRRGVHVFFMAPSQHPDFIIHIGVQAGGIFVNKEAIRHLRRILTEAQIPEDDVEAWLRFSEEEFERSLKMEFPRPVGRHTITIDRGSYNNHAVGIKNGRLSLTT